MPFPFICDSSNLRCLGWNLDPSACKGCVPTLSYGPSCSKNTHRDSRSWRPKGCWAQGVSKSGSEFGPRQRSVATVASDQTWNGKRNVKTQILQWLQKLLDISGRIHSRLEGLSAELHNHWPFPSLARTEQVRQPETYTQFPSQTTDERINDSVAAIALLNTLH